MTYQDQLEQTAEATAAQVLAALALYQAGRLTADALVAVVAAYVAAGNSAAAVLADLSLSAAVTVQTGQAAAPLGISRPLDDPARLTLAARTILDDLTAHPDHDAALAAAQTRFLRLAESEIKEAAARAYSAAVKESRHVTGWTRGISGSACQLCRWWSRGGQVWPDDHPMPTHKGCTCNPVPVTR